MANIFPELNDTIAGVNCIFNKIISDYTKEYFNTVRAMQIELVKNEEDINNFTHLTGKNTVMTRQDTSISTPVSHSMMA